MPGYPKLEKYAPEQTESVDTLEKRFVGLTDIQIFLFSIPPLHTHKITKQDKAISNI